MSESASLAEGLTIGISDAPRRGQVTLRGDLSDNRLAQAVKSTAVVDLPDIRCVTSDTDSAAIWMSPDELLLLVDDGPAAVAELDTTLAGQHRLALDVSDARTILRLTGARVGEVLAKGVPVDVSDRAFPPGSARRTHLGQIAVVFWRLDAETWEIACFRSYAHHLRAWLEQAAVPGSEVY